MQRCNSHSKRQAQNKVPHHQQSLFVISCPLDTSLTELKLLKKHLSLQHQFMSTSPSVLLVALCTSLSFWDGNQITAIRKAIGRKVIGDPGQRGVCHYSQSS